MGPVVEPHGDDLARQHGRQRRHALERRLADQADAVLPRGPVEKLDDTVDEPAEAARRRRCATRPSAPIRRRPAASRRSDCAVQHAVLDRVDQRLPAGLDDVLADADGAPDLVAVAGVEQHARHGAGALVLVEDAHLVVDELDVGQLRILPRDRLAQRGVERVDRAVALGGAHEALAVDCTLMVASATALPSARFSTITRKLSSRNSGSCGASSRACSSSNERVGRLVVVAAVLEVLDALERPLATRSSSPSSSSPSSLRLRSTAPLPESSETSMRGSLPTTAGSTCSKVCGAALAPRRRAGRPCARRRAAHVRLRAAQTRDVDDLGDEVGRLAQALELLVARALEPHLQRERRDDRDQVGVAAALAVAVDRALHLASRRPRRRRGCWRPRSRRRCGCGCRPAAGRRCATTAPTTASTAAAARRRWCRRARPPRRPASAAARTRRSAYSRVVARSRRRSARRRRRPACPARRRNATDSAIIAGSPRG